MPSIHGISNVKPIVVRGLELNQARARVFHFKHYVNNDDRKQCEAQNVQPTPLLTTRHAIAGQEGTYYRYRMAYPL
jgi:hypothetical protein